jgi:acid stress-induced BolA-like protein IbaG/YrbA
MEKVSMREREEIKRILGEELGSAFEDAEVDVTDGFHKNIHVTVISGFFSGMPEERKQELLWAAVDGSPLSEEEKQLISLMLPLSPDEVPVSKG